jgi:hypothetical protein
MIRVEPSEHDGVSVHLESRQPLVYLDQWAIYRFATQESLRTRFLEVLKTKGTLMFSWMNVAEIATLDGASREKVEAFLEAIGIHWFPLEVNVDRVLQKEQEGRKLDASFDEEFIKQFYPHIHGQEVLSLSKIVALTADDIQANKAMLEKHKDGFLAFIADTKAKIRKQPELARRFATVPFDPNAPANHVYIEIYRPLIVDPGCNLSRNDAVDCFHAVVAAAYSDAVLLDKKWCNALKTLRFPPSRRVIVAGSRRVGRSHLT